jgi:hypothetical protein
LFGVNPRERWVISQMAFAFRGCSLLSSLLVMDAGASLVYRVEPSTVTPRTIGLVFAEVLQLSDVHE